MLALFSIIVVASATPFHTLTIENIDSRQFQIGKHTRTVLPQVLLQTPDIAIFLDSHSDLLPIPLGPKGTQSWMIEVETPADAIRLATRLSQDNWNAWVDMSLPKTRFNAPINDPNYAGQWYLDTLEMPVLWEDSWGTLRFEWPLSIVVSTSPTQI